MQPGGVGLAREAPQYVSHGAGVEPTAWSGRGLKLGHAGQYIEAVSIPLAATLPGQCGLCHGWGTARLCDTCVRRFASPRTRCMRCALAVPQGQPLCGACLTSPPAFDRAVAAVDYTHPWDGLITRFKFHQGLDLASALAGLLARAVRESDLVTPSLLLPVPLSEPRLRERGYNQAWELARRVAHTLHLKADAHLLLRMRDTPHQIALPHERRAANVRGAFAVEPRRRHELEGARVAVVDDVVTTGATVGEIAQVLMHAGASEVQVWMLARTPRPEDRA
jgi:ComF family protein